MKVVTLITIPDELSFNNCTLALESLRVAFPTANVRVYINYSSRRFLDRIKERVIGDVEFHTLNDEVTHYEWIEWMIQDTVGELIIVDPDIIFWKEWTHKFDTLLAGAHVPIIWNEFAQCISYQRLHTSFLQIRDCGELIKTINEKYPMALACPDYAPLNVFKPVVTYVNGHPMFWDTCSILYNMLGGTVFQAEQLECYDHVNSSSFVDIMSKNMEHGKQFKEYHALVSENPALLKGANATAVEYYARMAEKARLYLQPTT